MGSIEASRCSAPRSKAGPNDALPNDALPAQVICSTVATGQLAADAEHAAADTEITRGAGGWLWRHRRKTRLQRVSSELPHTRAGPCPLEVTRTIVAEPPSLGGAVQLRLEVTNPAGAAGAAGSAGSAGSAVVLEALGLTMAFDQDFAGRTLMQASAARFAPPHHQRGAVARPPPAAHRPPRCCAAVLLLLRSYCHVVR